MIGIDLRLPAPYVATIDCGGSSHRVRFEAGRLEALDHADLDGERALAALAGERCACLDVVDGWETHRGDLRVLVLASRGPGDKLAPVQGRQGSQGRGWVAQGARNTMLRRSRPGAAITFAPPAVTPPSVAPGAVRRRPPPPAGASRGFVVRHGMAQAGMAKLPDPTDPLAAILGTDPGLTACLEATVAATWSARIAAGDEVVGAAVPALTAALYGRVAPAVRRWLVDPGLAVDVDMIAPGAAPAVERTEEGMRVALPFDWVASVWARDLTVVLDRFVVAAHPSASGSSLTLHAVGRDLDAIGRITIAVT